MNLPYYHQIYLSFIVILSIQFFQNRKMCDLMQSNKTLSRCQSSNNSYFELSINTQKLNSVFNSIQQTLVDHDSKISRNYSDLIKLIQSIQSKLSLETQKTNMMFTKLNKQIGQNSNILKLYVADLDNSIKKNQAKINNAEKDIILTKSMINRLGDEIKEDMFSGLAKLKREVIGVEYYLEEKQNSKMADNKEENEKISKIEAQNERHESHESPEITKQKEHEQKLIKLQNFGETSKYFCTKIKNLEESLPSKIERILISQQEKLKKIQKQEFIKMGLKKDQISRDYLDKENNNLKSLNKFAFPSPKPMKIEEHHQRSAYQQNRESSPRKEFHKNQRHMSLRIHDTDFELYQNFKELESKVTALEKNQLNDFRNKTIVLDEKNSIISRKIDKLVHEIGELKLQTRKLQGSKTEERPIQELRNYVKWAIRDLEQKLCLKCEMVELESEKKKIYEKIAILHENLLERAEKGEIQKALIFLQGKIKQIILLIASEQNEDRDGAIIKTAIKCLSCDKDLENNLNPLKKTGQIPKSSSYSRSLTHRTRQKYKQTLKQTQTFGNESVDYF